MYSRRHLLMTCLLLLAMDDTFMQVSAAETPPSNAGVSLASLKNEMQEMQAATEHRIEEMQAANAHDEQEMQDMEARLSKLIAMTERQNTLVSVGGKHGTNVDSLTHLLLQNDDDEGGDSGGGDDSSDDLLMNDGTGGNSGTGGAAFDQDSWNPDMDPLMDTASYGIGMEGADIMRWKFLVFGPRWRYRSVDLTKRWMGLIQLVWSSAMLLQLYILLCYDFRLRKVFPQWKGAAVPVRGSIVLAVVLVGLLVRMGNTLLGFNGLPIKCRYAFYINACTAVTFMWIVSFILMKRSETMVKWAMGKLQTTGERKYVDLTGDTRIPRNHVIEGTARAFKGYSLLLAPGNGPVTVDEHLRHSLNGHGDGVAPGLPICAVDDEAVDAYITGNGENARISISKVKDELFRVIESVVPAILKLLWYPVGGGPVEVPKQPLQKPTKFVNGSIMSLWDGDAPVYAKWLVEDGTDMEFGGLVGLLCTSKDLCKKPMDDTEATEKAAMMAMHFRVGVLEKDIRLTTLSVNEYITSISMPMICTIFIASVVTHLFLYSYMGITECMLDKNLPECKGEFIEERKKLYGPTGSYNISLAVNHSDYLGGTYTKKYGDWWESDTRSSRVQNSLLSVLLGVDNGPVVPALNPGSKSLFNLSNASNLESLLEVLNRDRSLQRGKGTDGDPELDGEDELLAAEDEVMGEEMLV